MHVIRDESGKLRNIERLIIAWLNSFRRTCPSDLLQDPEKEVPTGEGCRYSRRGGEAGLKSSNGLSECGVVWCVCVPKQREASRNGENRRRWEVSFDGIWKREDAKIAKELTGAEETQFEFDEGVLTPESEESRVRL